MRDLSRSSARRLCLALLVCLATQLAAPAPALAWFGWLDKWSGPGQWIGTLVDVRIKCWGDQVLPDGLSTQRRVLIETRKRLLDTIDVASTRPDSEQAAIRRSIEADLQRLIDLLDDRAIIATFKLSPLRQRQRKLLGVPLAAKVPTAQADGSLDFLSRTFADTITQLRDVIPQIVPPDSDPQGRGLAAPQPIELGVLRARVDKALGDLIRVAGDEIRPADIQGGSGAFVSLCRDEKSRDVALDIDWRNWFNVRTSQEFAQGQPLYFTTGSLAASVRLTNARWGDWVDVGVAGGLYGLFGKEVRPSYGWVIEPIRLDFHVPSAASSRGGPIGNALSRLTVRWSLMMFPGGIEAAQFDGVRRVDGTETIKSFGLFLKLL